MLSARLRPDNIDHDAALPAGEMIEDAPSSVLTTNRFVHPGMTQFLLKGKALCVPLKVIRYWLYILKSSECLQGCRELCYDAKTYFYRS